MEPIPVGEVIPACPHTFSFGGTFTPRDWHLGVQAKICGYTFWKSVIGVNTSTASRTSPRKFVILYHYDQRSFLLPEFEMHLLKSATLLFG